MPRFTETWWQRARDLHPRRARARHQAEALTSVPWGQLSLGEPEPLGVTPRGSGVNVAVFSAHADAIEFCVFENDREIRRVRLRGRTGDVFHDHVDDVAAGVHYGLRAHGPYLPHEGHYFNPAKLLADPYARAVDRPFRLHDSMFGYRNGVATDLNSSDDFDSAPFVPKCVEKSRSIRRRPNRALAEYRAL
jgi:glycogen operon protein